MNLRLLLVHFKIGRLPLITWGLGLFVLGVLSVFWAPETLTLGPAYLPVPTVESIPLYLTLYALVFGSGCLARRHSDDVLLTLATLPLRRRQIVFGKSIFFALSLAGLFLTAWGATALAGEVVEAGIDIAHLAITMAVGYLLVMAVYTYTLIASAWCSNQRSALALAAFVTFAAYLANAIGSGYEALEPLVSASIFHYYDPTALLQDGIVDWLSIGVLGGIAVGGHLVALAIFARRDLSV